MIITLTISVPGTRTISDPGTRAQRYRYIDESYYIKSGMGNPADEWAFQYFKVISGMMFTANAQRSVYYIICGIIDFSVLICMII